MNCTDIVDLGSDDELSEVDVKPVKLEPPGFAMGEKQPEEYRKIQLTHQHKPIAQHKRQELNENRTSFACMGRTSKPVLEQGQSPLDHTGISSISPICPTPVCRQFWKAGSYDGKLGSKVSIQNGKSYLHVHPMFLHSNATSHKWAFGAIAELLDNSVDEIQNGATFVIVDKISNPRDGSPALLIQDDGGGMDPEAMRRCMSFGFSDKKSKSAIGQYGNGFKTSSMRLGADVIVFSRHMNNSVNKVMTQSIGLLSYTFLTKSGHDRIVVPMVDYELNPTTGTLEILHSREHFTANLSVILQWSPYSTEIELLKQFDDIGSHGTKIVIYNLWFNEDRNVELDFDSDTEDICIGGDIQKLPGWKAVNEQHIAKRFRYSLRVYMSILYLRIDSSFRMILRGKDVGHHNIADDLKYPEYILYKPQSGGIVEGKLVTTIGFLIEAPRVNIHGFCVYHKNRLILPFWQVVSYADSRGRGVVGVLEANDVQPTHDKQDFEKTSLFQKLEVRLKEMTWEYWDFHCGLIGYTETRKPRPSLFSRVSSPCTPPSTTQQQSGPAAGGIKVATVVLDNQHGAVSSSCPLVGQQSTNNSQQLHRKRKEHVTLPVFSRMKRRAEEGGNAVDSEHTFTSQHLNTTASRLKDQEAFNLAQQNKNLRAKCMEYEEKCVELNVKVAQLRSKLGDFQDEYDKMLAELESLDDVIKDEKDVNA